MRRTFALAAMVLLCGSLASAEVPGPAPAKDSRVGLRIPPSLWRYEGLKGFGAFHENWTIVVEKSPEGRIRVNGDPEWQTAGFPSQITWIVTSVGPNKIELKSPKSAATEKRLTLNFKPPAQAAECFPKLAVSQQDIDAFQREADGLLTAKFFVGPLAGLPDDTKASLIKFARQTAGGTRIDHVTYKERLYLEIDLGSDSNVYNELKLNESQRVGRVLNDRLLRVLKAFAEIVAGTPAIEGLKLDYAIPHKSFADQSAISENDRLELYAPTDLIKQFSEADITSQKFIDGCSVIIDGNRVEVQLTAS